MQMIKRDKGITLISLSIAVIIILTITGMIIYSAKDSIYIRNLTNMQNDLSNLRDKVSLYYSEYGDIPAETEYPDISKLQLANVIGANDTGKFLIIELEYLEGLTLNYGKDYEKYKAKEYTNLTDLTDIYIINAMKGWQALKKAINNDGMLGWVQPIGASPEIVTQNMTEVYGAASLMLVGEQLIRYFEKK